MSSRPTRILAKSKLRAAWIASRDSSNNAGRAGFDGITAARFAANLDYNLAVLAEQLKKNLYGPAPLKAIFIPKTNSDNERMICIPTVRDRLVQRAIVAYLSRTKKLPIYHSSSFGFLPQRETNAAVEVAVNYRQSFDWCLKTDIESFFDRIPRQYLKGCVAKALGKHSLVPIINRTIDCEVRLSDRDRPKFHKQGIKVGVGIRQGMPLSPILANLVLSSFDKRIEKHGLRMVRYADDIVVFTDTKEEAKNAHAPIDRLLKDIELSIPGLAANTKTQILGPHDPIDFLGREIVRVGLEKQSVWRVSRKQIAKIVRRLENEYTLEARLKEKSNFQETIVDLRNSITAYFSIYKGANNFPSLDAELQGVNRRIIRYIFIDLFGEEALARITPEQQKFLGLGRLDLHEAEVMD
ncbi:reverse transcriptase domain-containing protein [Bradyrhizobium sp. HKCCYLS3077]|uniref:reverse transcriptase domain-containing protein n=1 Tax=Bradyrhizobium sp. HKCCYLS3077 TaxID=3420761 RepID=UPI003EBF42F3